jgi:hypothetical protein
VEANSCDRWPGRWKRIGDEEEEKKTSGGVKAEANICNLWPGGYELETKKLRRDDVP